jgi:hypothetical protein
VWGGYVLGLQWQLLVRRVPRWFFFQQRGVGLLRVLRGLFFRVGRFFLHLLLHRPFCIREPGHLMRELLARLLRLQHGLHLLLSVPRWHRGAGRWELQLLLLPRWKVRVGRRVLRLRRGLLLGLWGGLLLAVPRWHRAARLWREQLPAVPCWLIL